jgi:hypothetical protein
VKDREKRFINPVGLRRRRGGSISVSFVNTDMRLGFSRVSFGVEGQRYA